MCVEIIFWISVLIVFYTYIGYGIILYLLVRIKEFFFKPKSLTLPEDLPHVTLLIAAYNEQDIVDEKMFNTLALDYPPSHFHIVWVTDGSTDHTNALLAGYPQVKVLFEAPRRGKSAALNRAIQFVDSPIVIFTDANTMLNKEAIQVIVSEFTNPQVGCVAGEKRVKQNISQDATAGEGFYWKYESFLKNLDYRLYSAVGAAGELFAIRTSLFVHLPDDTLLDDFIMSMKIAQDGYKIAYCKEAYAEEEASEDISQETKRKIRIAAGGMQSIVRLSGLLNIFRHGLLSFQYISHRVLRWSITPILWFCLLPLNVYLALSSEYSIFYGIILLLHILFYMAAIAGYLLSKRKIKTKLLFVPYYFIFMNLCVLRGFAYLRKQKGSGVWEKAKRKNGKKGDIPSFTLSNSVTDISLRIPCHRRVVCSSYSTPLLLVYIHDGAGDVSSSCFQCHHSFILVIQEKPMGSSASCSHSY